MYQYFFGLSEKPFHTTPDPHFLFPSPSHQEALATLFYGVDQRQGFLTIIGEVGVGKTTVLRTFLEQLESTPNHSIFIYNPNLTFHSLLKNILEELGQPPSGRDTATLIQQLQDILIQEFRKGGTIVLLIDEAQNMPIATLENLRMLSNIETTTDKLIQIVLIGQPELDNLLNKVSLRQLKQRITLRSTIQPLTQKESMDYIEHRLAKAGTKSSTVFTKQALKLIVREAQGIPRRLNILCDNTLLTGYAYQQKPIPAKTAKEVIADIRGEDTQQQKKWLPVAIAAGLLLIITIPFLQANTQFLSFQSQKENDRELLTVNSAPDKPIRVEPSPLQDSPGKITQDDGTQQTTDPPLETLALSSFHKDSTMPSSLTEAHTNPHDSRIRNKQPPKKLSANEQTQTKIQPKHLSPANSAIYAKSSTDSIRKVPDSIQKKPSPIMKSPMKVLQVKRGDTLSELIRATYGKSSPKHVEWVLEHNPHILSARVLFPGQTVSFPPINLEQKRR